MKVRLLKKAWNPWRLIKIAKNSYAVQYYEREYGWTSSWEGTLAQMLNKRHEIIRKYIRNHSELFEGRVKVIC